MKLSSFGEDPVQPVSGLLDSTRSFDYAALHFGRQVSKVIGAPTTLAIFAKRSLKAISIEVIIMGGGHDASPT
jgi:hypothetical protein